MLQFISDSLFYGIADFLTGDNILILAVIVPAIIIAGMLGVRVLTLRVRLDEARQKSSQTTVNIPPSMNGLYIMVGVIFLVLIVIAVR